MTLSISFLSLKSPASSLLASSQYPAQSFYFFPAPSLIWTSPFSLLFFLDSLLILNFHFVCDFFRFDIVILSGMPDFLCLLVCRFEGCLIITHYLPRTSSFFTNLQNPSNIQIIFACLDHFFLFTFILVSFLPPESSPWMSFTPLILILSAGHVLSLFFNIRIIFPSA